MSTKCLSMSSLLLLLALFGCAQRTKVLKPSGPIVQVPPAVMFRGEPDPYLAKGKPPPDQIAEKVAAAKAKVKRHPDDPKTLNDAGCVYAAAGDNKKTEGGRVLQASHRQRP